MNEDTSASASTNRAPVSEAVYPTELKSKEAEFIKRRRDLVDLEKSLPVVGLALSGGGIRSATFCLGVLQAISRHGFLKKVDYLSTISGGGYIGGFLGRLFTRKPASEASAYVAETLASTTSDPLKYLRENGRYLSPNGGGGPMQIAAVYLRNWCGIHFTLGTFLLFLFLSLNMLRFGGTEVIAEVVKKFVPFLTGPADVLSNGSGLLVSQLTQVEGVLLEATQKTVWWSPWVVLPLAVGVLWVIPAAWAYWCTQFAVRMRAVWTGIAVLAANLAAIMGAGYLFARGHDATVPFPKEIPMPLLSQGVVQRGIGFVVLVVAAISAVQWAVAALSAVIQNRAGKGGDRAFLSKVRTTVVRSMLTNWLRAGMTLALVLAAIAFIDTLGQSIYALSRHNTQQPLFKMVLSATGLAGVLATLFKYSGVLNSLMGQKGDKAPMWQRHVMALVSAAGYVVAIVVLTFWCWAAHALSWGAAEPYQGAAGAAMARQSAPPKSAVDLNKDSLIHVTPGGVQDPPDPAPYPPTAGLADPNSPTRKAGGGVLAFAWLMSLIISWCVGYGVQFLNLSALQTFYGGRLTRAYLGASHPHVEMRDINKVKNDDDLGFSEYRPDVHGGPLHLIGTTLNETVSGHSETEDKDRHGMILAVGPAGISGGIRDHAMWNPRAKHPANKDKASKKLDTIKKQDAMYIPVTPVRKPGSEQAYHIFQSKKATGDCVVEALTVGNWVSISGAAFSTGMGANTKAGLSILLAFANVRLGYYWDSGIKPWWRNAKGRSEAGLGWLAGLWEKLITHCPVHTHLIYEMLARFHGPNRKLWYLSDGGHFENTGCYELIRRRVPFIVCCDCGADPDYTMEDISNLVRKARIDFQSEITFVTQEFIDKNIAQELHPVIGTLFQLQRQPNASLDATGYHGQAYSAKHATLAWVTYPGDSKPATCILFIKPSLTSDEPQDVKQYHAINNSFPQESTLDQFFDEAQWESYRRLGEHIGDLLFSNSKETGWHPSDGTIPGYVPDPPVVAATTP